MNIKNRGKVMLGAFINFVYFSSYLQKKETARKRSIALFSEPEMLVC